MISQTSLVVQWLFPCFYCRGVQVWSLIREVSMCRSVGVKNIKTKDWFQYWESEWPKWLGITFCKSKILAICFCFRTAEGGETNLEVVTCWMIRWCWGALAELPTLAPLSMWIWLSALASIKMKCGNKIGVDHVSFQLVCCFCCC